MGTHLLTKTRATRSRGRQNSPAQQHAKSQISPMVRPRTSNEGAFDRLASRSTRLKHRLVAVSSLSLWYVTVARRYGLFDCSDFFSPLRIGLLRASQQNGRPTLLTTSWSATFLPCSGTYMYGWVVATRCPASEP